jgi:outer membrane protein assembly factor BamB
MKLFFSLLLLSAFASLPLTIGNTAADTEWPQWRGPLRDGKSSETGLLKAWPEKGPAVTWAISNLGEGYGSLAIRGERIYVQGTSEAKSTVFCLNRADGKQIWSVAFGPRLDQDKGNGPRGTPTLDGDRLYVLTENGDLACLKASDGSRVWGKNILKEYGGSNPRWLVSESPLIDGEKLIVSPGGKEAGIVALDKLTGKEIWRTKELSAETSYASNIIAEVGGVRGYINFTSSAAVGVRASDGKLMWSYSNANNRVANCATPVFADNKVFFSSAYGTGGALLNLTAEKGEVKATEAYFTKEMQNHHGGMVLVDGYLYGFSNAILTCIEFNTGKVMWKDRSVGKGSLTYADGMLYLLGEKQLVGLAEANPKAYTEKGRFPINDRGWDSWAHPVVLGGKLYIRNQNELTCYDVKGK